MAQHPLLDLQHLDTHIDQLRHQISALPEHALHAQATNDVTAVEVQISAQNEKLSALKLQESSIEDSADKLQSRIGALDSQIASPNANARDLPRMSEELVHLKTQRDELDGHALVLMDDLESNVNEAKLLAERLGGLHDQLAAHESALKEKSTGLQREIEEETTKRASVTATIPGPLLSEYEKLRARLGGQGASELVNGACSGCHMAFSSAELQVMHKSSNDQITHCEQCGRILVLE